MTIINPTIKTNLEKIILVHNTAVGQRLGQFIGQGGFTPICDPKKKRRKKSSDKLHFIVILPATLKLQQMFLIRNRIKLFSFHCLFSCMLVYKKTHS